MYPSRPNRKHGSRTLDPGYDADIESAEDSDSEAKVSGFRIAKARQQEQGAPDSSTDNEAAPADIVEGEEKSSVASPESSLSSVCSATDSSTGNSDLKSECLAHLAARKATIQSIQRLLNQAGSSREKEKPKSAKSDPSAPDSEVQQPPRASY